MRISLRLLRSAGREGICFKVVPPNQSCRTKEVLRRSAKKTSMYNNHARGSMATDPRVMRRTAAEDLFGANAKNCDHAEYM